jgi:glycosyltransferase involved in cell wall biosynthesis
MALPSGSPATFYPPPPGGTAIAGRPRVSIGVPVFNGERYLAVTLDSLLAQTYTEFELIISDNASTDATWQICERYAERDRRVRIVRNSENLGAAANYRRLVDLASGEYFRWANSDDFFCPPGLERCVAVLDQEPSVVLVYPKTFLIDENGATTARYEDGLDLRMSRASDRFRQVMTKMGLVNVLYGLMRTAVLRRTGLLRDFPGGDLPLVAELTLHGEFWEIPDYLFGRRMHPTASSSYRQDVGLTQEFFDPRKRGRPPMREWRHLGAHLRSVLVAPLGPAERLRVLGFLGRASISNREVLMRELGEGARHVLSSINQRHS